MHIFSKNSSMSLLRTIVIDDESHIRQTLSKMVNRHCKNVKLVAEANSVRSGVESIKKHAPDLVLLDIKMNDGTGFDMLKQLEPVDFKVIFITAFDQYAIRAFKFSAIDYILKPVDIDELVAAVNRADELVQAAFRTQLEALGENLDNKDKTLKKLILRTHDNIHLVKVKDIGYCMADGNYLTVSLVNGKKVMVTNISLKEYEDLLAEYGFFRVHKSYLINLHQIDRFEKMDGGSVVMTDESKVPVASRKKEQLMEMFEQLGGN
jgi:two-component system LytT family response regulator